jgi:hypothetical protein
MSPNDQDVNDWAGQLLTRLSSSKDGDLLDIEDQEKKTTEMFQQYRLNQQESVRTYITFGVVGVFCLCVLLLILTGLCPWIAKNPEYPTLHAAQVEILEKLLSPVVFLVLGYYFGSERK